MSDIIDFDVLLGKERTNRKPRRKRSWITKLAVLSLALLVAARISLAYWLPGTVTQLGERLGLDLEFEKVKVSLLAGSVEFQGLRVAPLQDASTPANPTLLNAEQLTLQLDLWALTGRKLHVQDAQVSGAEAHLYRDSKGRWGWEEMARRWDSGTASSGIGSTTLAGLTFQDLDLHVHDRDRPVLQGLVHIRAKNPSMPEGEVQWSLQVLRAPWASELQCDWEERGDAIVGDIRAKDLRGAPFAPWLADLGLRVSTTSHDLQAVWNYKDGAGEEGPRLVLSDAHLRADGTPQLKWDRLQLDLQSSASGDWKFSNAEALGLPLRAERGPEGSVRWAGLARSDSGPGPIDWNLSIDRLHMPDADLHWSDHSISPAAEFHATIQGHLEPLSWNSKRGLAPGQVNLELGGSGLADSLVIVGDWRSGATGAANLRIKGDGLNLDSLSPYLATLGLESRWNSARLDLRIESQWQGKGPARSGSIAVHDFYWKDGSEVARLSHGQARYAEGRWSEFSAKGGELGTMRTELGDHVALGFSRLPDSEGVDLASLSTVQLEDVRWTATDPLGTDPGSIHGIRFLHCELENWNGSKADGPSRWSMTLEWPGVAGNVEGHGAWVEDSWQGGFDSSGLQEGPLTQWLAQRGLQSDLQGSRLAFDFQTQNQSSPDHWTWQVALKDLLWQRDSVTWLKLRGLDLNGCKVPRANPLSAIEIESARIDGPQLALTHLPNGDWLAGGLSWSPAAQEKDAAHPGIDFAQALLQTDGTHLEVVDAQLALRDESVEPPFEAHVTVQAHGRNEMRTELDLQLGPQFERTWSMHVQSQASDAGIDLVGSHFHSGDSTHWQAELEVMGSQMEALESYLPDSLTAQLADTRLIGRWKGQSRALDQGGVQFELDSDLLSLTRGQTALMRYEDLHLEMLRLDLDAGVVSLGPIACDGLQLDVARSTDGSVHALGFSLDPSGLQALPQDLARFLRSNEPSRQDAANQFFLGPIDLKVADLNVHDEFPAAARSARAQGRLHMPGRFTWGYEPGGEAAPLALHMQGSVQGLFKDAHLDLRTTPFAPSPSMEIDFAADGLQGRKLTPWLPAFLGDVQCSDLHGGRIAGHLGLDLELPESERPWSAAIDHGFGAYLTVEDFKLLENPISAPLMAFDFMQVKAPKVHRTHGRVERIEVTGPNLRTWQDGQGLHLGGLLWKRSPHWDAMLADAWTVDALQLKRLQWDHQDRTVEPIWHMPIRDGQVQAFDLATHFQDGDPPMRVNASLSGGEVSLPLREPDTLEALRQMEAEGASAPSGPRAMESRRAFERLEIQGRLSGWTEPEASLQVKGTAFELAGLAGLAKRHGLWLQDGLLDQTHVFRIQPGSGFTWNATHRTDLLNVQESRPGSFVTARNWPCDLPTFLQGLRVEEGGQRLAMQVQLPAAWPARSEWTGALNASFQRAAEASHAKAQELAQAQAPSSATAEGNSLQIEFEPASARLTPQAKAELTSWSSKLGRGSRPALRLSHTFGLEDLNRAQILGTPPTETLQALLSKLRQRKALLARDRQALETTVSNSMPSGTASRWSPMHEEFARLDQQQIANEEALDRVLNLLTPGSERRQSRRTRSAALSLAQLRQDAVVRFLKDRGWPTSTSPIHTRPPQFTHRNPGQGGRILIRAGR